MTFSLNRPRLGQRPFEIPTEDEFDAPAANGPRIAPRGRHTSFSPEQPRAPAEKSGDPSFQTGKLSLTGTGATLGELNLFLSRELREPVIDQTGLAGLFNYTLDINANVTGEMRKSDGPPMEANRIIAQAMLAQLGLKVDAKKVPVPMLVVDHPERSPMEN